MSILSSFFMLHNLRPAKRPVNQRRKAALVVMRTDAAQIGIRTCPGTAVELREIFVFATRRAADSLARPFQRGD